jgi:hypothetical protein
MLISRLKWRPLSRRTETATAGKSNQNKTKASVSCPTEALFFAAVSLTRCYPEISPKAFRYCDGLQAIVSTIFFGFSSKTATKVSEISRVANFGDEPRLGPHIWGLVRNRLTDWHRAEGDRMTRLRNRDVVLASVLGEEQSLFSLQQGCQVEPTHGHINFKFHFFYSWL